MMPHEYFTNWTNIPEVEGEGEQEQFSNFMDRVLRLAVNDFYSKLFLKKSSKNKKYPTVRRLSCIMM